MSDIWAARKDDELIHTSPLADIASAVAEVAVYSLATAAVAAAAAAAAPALAGVAVLGRQLQQQRPRHWRVSPCWVRRQRRLPAVSVPV